MFRYHKKIGFPKSIFIPDEISVSLKLSKHAKHKAKQKHLTFTGRGTIEKIDIIEISSLDNKTINKIVVRIPANWKKNKDLIFVVELLPHTFKGKLITFWLNDKKDRHKTLDKSKYDRP